MSKTKVRKAIIPLAGLGTRFLPLSKLLAKEFWPLVDTPVVHYIIEEAVNSGIKDITFVVRPGDRKIAGYFKRDPRLEQDLKKRGKSDLLKALRKMESFSKKANFSFAYQKQALGDGHAVLQAKKLSRDNPSLVLFGDDIVCSKTPCAKQLIDVYHKYGRPVIALCRMPKDKLSSYGIARVEKIGQKLYKIKDIVEKPSPQEAPSNLAIVGKYVIDKTVFHFLEHTPSIAKGEIRLAGAFNEMINREMDIYGYEFEGEWLECGNKLAYLKSNLYLSLNHPQFGKELKKYLKNLGVK